MNMWLYVLGEKRMMGPTHMSTKAKPLNLTGPRIRQARLACRPAISQQELSRQLARKGVVLDQTAISRIEQKQRGVLDYELVAIARCLKVTVTWLFRK
jgi:HTH-type transcriptional regulator, cell division transcriptional repressor